MPPWRSARRPRARNTPCRAQLRRSMAYAYPSRGEVKCRDYTGRVSPISTYSDGWRLTSVSTRSPALGARSTARPAASDVVGTTRPADCRYRNWIAGNESLKDNPPSLAKLAVLQAGSGRAAASAGATQTPRRGKARPHPPADQQRLQASLRWNMRRVWPVRTKMIRLARAPTSTTINEVITDISLLHQ